MAAMVLWLGYCAIGIGWTGVSVERAWRRRPWRVSQLQAMGFAPFASAVLLTVFFWPALLLPRLAWTALYRLVGRVLAWLGMLARPGRPR